MIFRTKVFITIRFICIAFMALFLPSISSGGETYTLDFNVNGSVLETRFEGEWPVDLNFISGGVGLLYHQDDYALGNLDVSMGGTLDNLNMRFNLGLKGIYGEVTAAPDDATFSTVAFILSAAFEPGQFYDIPIEVIGLLAGAAGPMTFQDAEGYVEFKTTIGLYILRDHKGALYGGYRFLNVDLDEEFDDSDLSDHQLFVGFKFKF